MNNFIQNIDELIDYNWESEQQSWEEEHDDEYPTVEPKKDDGHIFATLHRIDRFLHREVSVYGKKRTVGDILDRVTDDELYAVIENMAEQVAQERGFEEDK